MHATYPLRIQRQPGLWSGLLGVVVGALLMIATFGNAERADLTLTSQPAQPVGVTQTTSEMLWAHWRREHPGSIDAAGARAPRTQVPREHQFAMTASGSVTLARHFAIEHPADVVLPVTLERHFALEHRSDTGP